jgi:hypothetical protein
MSSSPPEMLKEDEVVKKSPWKRFLTERPGIWVLPLLAIFAVGGTSLSASLGLLITCGKLASAAT